MRILALDTCLGACSVAIWQDGVVLARDWQPMQRGHAEALLPMVEHVRAQSGLDHAAFDRLAVSTGPGSFAGVRVGLAAARGICVARGLPMVGVNTLELLAISINGETPDGGASAAARRVGAALDARNDQIYFQAFDGDYALCRPALMTLSEASALIATLGGAFRLVGSGAAALAQLCADHAIASHRDLLPDAAILAAIAASRPAMPGDMVAPLYLRAPGARLPVKSA